MHKTLGSVSSSTAYKKKSIYFQMKETQALKVGKCSSYHCTQQIKCKLTDLTMALVFWLAFIACQPRGPGSVRESTR